ncbi:MAG: 4'-phosphopantetheinyl transferase superfamily protein [Bacteroidetes bacterium]|nr:MAG: 4'-phosphopantetheinyl transferase superfamily protein [Bacteroidota bacterium]
MAFIPLKSETPEVLLGAWKIEEEELYFFTRLKLYENEWKRLASISHPHKRLEWLSSRLCLKELLKIGHTDRVESLSSQEGKPYLSNHPYKISYTHSFPYSAAIATPEGQVGIDMEYFGRKRNTRTAYLFMNEAELDFFHQHPHQREVFTLLWSAKETVYKSFGQRGLSFKEHIFLQLLEFEPASQGTLTAIVHTNGHQNAYDIHYQIHPDFLLTYTLDTVPMPIKEIAN